MSVYNEYIRNQMIRQRQRVRGDTCCDLCRLNEGTDRHHIITKWSTMNNPRARELAEHQTLSAWLCQPCHRKADSVEVRDILFQRLYALYGYEAVKVSYEAVKRFFGLGFLVELPDPANADDQGDQ